MNVTFYVGAGLVLIFGLVVLVGAPYLPTLKPNVDEAIKLTGLKPGQRLLELGSGDGRVLLAAAKQGIHVVGYELNPILVLWSRVLTWRYRKLVVVKWGNFWLAKWPETDAIYTFLLQKYMKKLDNKVVQTYSGENIKLVSLAFTIPGKKPAKQVKGLYLYTY